jgi:hypothetical protein
MRYLDWWCRLSEGMSKTLEDTWPLWTIGMIGGTMLVSGLILLIYGW